jgi:serine phosphatase RsbU (regulator of sigma subunit)
VLGIAAVLAQIAAVFTLWQAVTDAVSLGVAFLYAVPIAVCAWWYGRRAGLAAALACLVLYVASAADAHVERLEWTAAVRAVAFVAAALVASWLRGQGRELQKTAAELEAIRHALTPPEAPELPGLDAAATLLAAEHQVAGDFSLLTSGPDGWSIAIVGDVVGHGPQAAQLATFVRVTLTSVATGSSDPAEILRLANRALRARAAATGELVTAACVACDPNRQALRWASAGHPPPIALPNGIELDPVRFAQPLGLTSELEITSQEAPFTDTSGVVLYTDGLYEARRDGEQFGLARVRAVVKATGARSAAEIAAALRRAVQQFTGGPPTDDICIVVLRRSKAATT